MTQDEIIEMAVKAGMGFNQCLAEFRTPLCDGVEIEELEAFTKLVAAKEREACAKLAEVSNDLEDWEIICGKEGRYLLNALAKAIRARGQE
jgi:hypothetical protein